MRETLFPARQREPVTTALIPVRRGRPPIITVDGCVIYLSVKDTEYLRLKTVLTQQMLAAHPDKAPARRAQTQAGRFRAARARLTVWRRRQRQVYWALHQMPPDWTGPLTPPPGAPRRNGYRLARLPGD